MTGIKTGQMIDGRYQVLGELSRGGMGALYHVRHRLTGREEALKVILAQKASRESYRKRFLTEAMAVAKLESPHTVTLFDCGYTDSELLYFTMELLKGRSLDEVIRKEGPLDWRRATMLAVQACLSLEEAHEQGILHRDLKPSNLFVGITRGGDEHVKVLDFGIARLRTDPRDLGTTMPGAVLGTPYYMSPEQAQGHTLDERSDIYSLGVVLYEMLSGRRPFEAEDFSTLKKKLRTEIPAPVGLVTPGVVVPGRLEKTVLACLAKAPDERPGSFKELRMTFETILGAGTQESPAPSSSQRSHPLALETTAESVDTRDKSSSPELGHKETTPALSPDLSTVSGVETLPPGGAGRRRGQVAVSAGIIAVALLLGFAGSFFGPVRLLNEKGEHWRQELCLADQSGRGVVVQMGQDEDVVTLRTAAHPVPGKDGIATWRLIDALLLDRLAAAEAGVVAFDKYYGHDHPDETAHLAAAIKKAAAADVPVILGTLHRPPPTPLRESGAYFGSTLALRSGFDGSIRSLLTGFTLLDGTDVPSLFVQAWCISREPPATVGQTSEGMRRCQEDVRVDDERWKLRFSQEPMKTLRASDVLAWPVDELKQRVKGKVVFVGHFEPGKDEVKIPSVPGLDSPAGTVHGVMLLATAYNQLDQHARWFALSGYLAALIFVLLAILPFLLMRRRPLFAFVSSLLLVLAVSFAGLFVPLDYPWGTTLLWGMLAAGGTWATTRMRQVGT